MLIRFTNEPLRQSVIGLDATLRQRLVTDVSNALDTALLTGTGTRNTITGLINQAGVPTEQRTENPRLLGEGRRRRRGVRPARLICRPV